MRYEFWDSSALAPGPPEDTPLRRCWSISTDKWIATLKVSKFPPQLDSKTRLICYEFWFIRGLKQRRLWEGRCGPPTS